MEKKALGKGIGAIFSDDTFVENISNQETLAYVDITSIKPNRFQPRRVFEHKPLEDLANSIKEKGVLQPITVRRLDSENYEIIAGERRWRASQIAGKTTIPVIIKIIEEHELLELALIENIQRDNLNPVETAFAYNQLIEELGFTQEEVSQKVGKDRSSVANQLRLLKLPKEVMDMLSKRTISFGHAKVLLGVPDNVMLRLAKKIESDGISVRKLEQIVKDLQTVQPNNNSLESAKLSRLFSEEEKILNDFLKTKVKIAEQKNNTGRVIINYSSKNDLDRILALFLQQNLQ